MVLFLNCAIILINYYYCSSNKNVQKILRFQFCYLSVLCHARVQSNVLFVNLYFFNFLFFSERVVLFHSHIMQKCTFIFCTSFYFLCTKDIFFFNICCLQMPRLLWLCRRYRFVVLFVGCGNILSWSGKKKWYLHNMRQQKFTICF